MPPKALCVAWPAGPRSRGRWDRSLEDEGSRVGGGDSEVDT